MGSESAVIEFFGLQGRRASVYKQYESGFDLFIQGQATESEFQQLIQAAQKNFVSISSAIIEVSEKVSEPFKSLIHRLQDLEKEKLKATIEYQSLRSETVFGPRDFTADSQSVADRIVRLRKEINEVLEELHCEVADNQVLEFIR
jgi:flagellar biosynthesis/type III secretory pathway chaperone